MQPAVDGHGLDARRAPDPRQQLLEEGGSARGIGIALRCERHPEHQQPVGRHTNIDAAEIDEGPQQDARAREEHQRQGNLGDDQRLARDGLARSAGKAAAGLAHRIRQVAAGGVQRRRQPADDAGQRRDRQREQQHRRVERDLGFIGNRVRRHERQDRREPRVSQRRADHAGGQRQEQALGEQLSNQPPPARAERHADGHLALPRARARQHQVRDVGAGDEQEQRHRAEQHPDVPADRARERLGEGQQADAPLVGKLGWIALLEVRDDRPQIGFRLRGADAGLQAPEQVHAAHAFDGLAPLERDRQVDVGAAPHEALRHHADDRAVDVVQAQLAAQDVGITAELPLPEAITQHGHRLRPRPGVRCGWRPPEDRRHPHHVEGVEGAVIAAKTLRIAIPGPQHVADRRGDHPFEDRAALGEFEELVGRVAGPPAALRRVRDAHARQVGDVLVGERVEHHGVEHAVDGRYRHDAETERQHGEDGEPGRPCQPPRAVADVSAELFEPRHHGCSPDWSQPRFWH